jgi:hypothetical protein
MVAACQRLRRRALVVLAWLVLALAVAPAPAGFEPVRPVAALVGAAARASAARSSPDRVTRVAAVAAPRRLSSPARSPGVPSLASLEQARGAPRADPSPWPAPDERWLYLKHDALLC